MMLMGFLIKPKEKNKVQFLNAKQFVRVPFKWLHKWNSK